MSMTRKHFEGIATILSENRAFLSDSQHEGLVNEFAEFCAAHNPRFDAQAFREASR